MLIAMGRIHPDSGWYFEEPLEVSFPDGTWTVIVRDSQFHVLINGEPPEDVATFRNEVASVGQGFLDSLGFLLAIPLQAEVRSILIGGDPVQLALYRQSWPDLLQDPQSPPQVKAADLEPFNVATVEVLEARAALADLRAALQYPDDTGFMIWEALRFNALRRNGVGSRREPTHSWPLPWGAACELARVGPVGECSAMD